MKTRLRLAASMALVLCSSTAVTADEPNSEITGLQSAAEEFVVAYNRQDAAALAALFTEDGEITDLHGDNITSGRADIQARYEDFFSADNAPTLAVEVDSVRILAPGLAVEDGTVHLTPPVEDAAPRSWQYTATLARDKDGKWLIASSRDLRDVTDAAGQLSELANGLKGDWTCMKDGLRSDMAFGWDASGKFLIGELLTTTADADPLSTSIRIGWNGARSTITWWTFDDQGGFTEGDWTPTDKGWIIRTTGTTASGEATSANQRLVFENEHTIIWTASERIIDGEKIPDNELRIVRQAPEPAAE